MCRCPSGLLSTTACGSSLRVHLWDFAPHYTGKDPRDRVCMPHGAHGVPQKPGLSPHFLFLCLCPACSLCPGPSEVLLSGPAWISLPLTFGIIILAPLGCWLSVMLSPTHKHGYMLLSGSLWVKPNKKHSHTQAFQLNTCAYSSASCHHPLAQRVQKRTRGCLPFHPPSAVCRVSRGESPPLR